jgi:hypothetical protein
MRVGNMFGYTLIKDEELSRLKDVETHAKGLLSEVDNPVPCYVMKKYHMRKLYGVVKGPMK